MSHIRGTHGQAQLSRSKGGPEADGSTAPYTHNSGSQQGKGENTANPRNGGTICPTLLISHKVCQSLIKNTSLSTHTSSG